MSKLKLLPCPFCLSTKLPPVMKEAPNHADVICYWVKCGNWETCKVRPSTWAEGTPEKVGKIWNERKK